MSNSPRLASYEDSPLDDAAVARINAARKVLATVLELREALTVLSKTGADAGERKTAIDSLASLEDADGFCELDGMIDEIERQTAEEAQRLENEEPESREEAVRSDRFEEMRKEMR